MQQHQQHHEHAYLCRRGEFKSPSRSLCEKKTNDQECACVCSANERTLIVAYSERLISYEPSTLPNEERLETPLLSAGEFKTRGSHRRLVFY